jgi:hypothetical protein
VIRWSNKFDQMIMEGARVIKQHISLPLDQICFITWSHLFYYPVTFHYLLIKLVLSPDHICFYHPCTFHYHLIKLVLSSDHICFITQAHLITSWSDLFYHMITFGLLPRHLSLPLDQSFVSPDHICFIIPAPSIITWSNLFYHLITFVM